MAKAQESFNSFDTFMRQSQVAQSGNPYWFGLNPKSSDKSKKLKGFSEFMSESGSEHDADPNLSRLVKLGLASDDDIFKWKVKSLLVDEPYGIEIDMTDQILQYLGEVEDAFTEAVWDRVNHLDPMDILEMTGNWPGEIDQDADLELESYMDQLGLEISGILLLPPDGEIRLLGNFYTRGGSDYGFNAILDKTGYSLKSLDWNNDVNMPALRAEILKAIQVQFS